MDNNQQQTSNDFYNQNTSANQCNVESQNNIVNQDNTNQPQQYQQFAQYQSQYPQPQYQQPSTYPMTVNCCPKCGTIMREKYRGWQIAIAIIFFPIGMLSLLSGKMKKCPNCGYEID